MAKITAVHLSGKIGKLVCFERNGKPISRIQADDVKQTKATKKAAKVFGKAVRVAKFLRQGLAPALPRIGGRWGEYRLADAVSKALDPQKTTASQTNTAPLLQLAYNRKTNLRERLRVSLETDWSQPGRVILTIPALNPVKHIPAPAHTQQVHWRIAVSGSSITRPIITGAQSIVIDMPYEATLLPAQRIALPFTVQPDTLNVLMVSLQYTAEKKRGPLLIKAQEWWPADIVGVQYETPVKKGNKKASASKRPVKLAKKIK